MKYLLILLTTLCCGNIAAQDLVINEVMQSNVDGIMDDLNDFPDSWVELYNPTATAVNLKNYKIGTKNKISKAWQLPDKTVGAGQYVIIYCDKAGEDEGVSAIHTDFRLETTKESNVYLFKDKDIVDELTLPEQPAPNIAYGRKTDGASEWGYQLTPTPGEANTGNICDKDHLLGAPLFSQEGRVIEGGGTITVALSIPEGSPEGTVIRYSVDGSEPINKSPVYSTPFTISSNKVIRAKLFCKGWLSPRSTCHSYLFFPTNRKLTLPVVSIITSNKYLTDQKIGIYVEGNYQSGKKNFEFNWRRPMNFEYFETSDNACAFNQLGEARIMGGQSRNSALKSLALYANKRFGEKRFAYEFFPDQKPGLKDFKSIMLRNAGNDFDYLYQRDAVMQITMARHADLDWQAYRPAIVYINGVYRGMLNIRERSNEDNI